MNNLHSSSGTPRSIAAQLVSSREDLVNEAKSPSHRVASARGSEGASAIPVSTDFSADEWLLVDDSGYEPCGLLFGVSVFHIGLVGVLSGNGEVATLSKALLEAREIATGKLQLEAERAGASGVVGVRLSIAQLGGKSHLARFVATGTGVRPKGASAETDDGTDPPFLTALSGQEFALLLRTGFSPVGLVMGVCVYHVQRLGSLAWMRTYFQSVEMQSYTEALYEARELAMGRIQAEAIALHSEGIVGVSTSELSHVWGSRVIEFFAIGTAVRSITDESSQVEPKCVLSLRDNVVSNPAAILVNNAPNGSH